MRTMIINTLGEAYARKDIYFLAFPPEQTLWLNTELDLLGDCVQQIQQIHVRQTEQQGYHLILLANLDSFESTEYADHRERVQKIVCAWLCQRLLLPLDALSLCPLSATVIFLNYENQDDSTSRYRSYCEMLRLDADALPEQVLLPYLDAAQNQRALDLTEILQDELHTYRQTREPGPAAKHAAAETVLRTPRLDIVERLVDTAEQRREKQRSSSLDDSISHTLESMQSFRLKKNAGKTLEIRSVLFQASMKDQAVAGADLHINLARLIRTMQTQSPPDLSVLRWHSGEELALLLADAEQTLRCQSEDEQKQPLFCQLPQGLYKRSDAAGMTNAIFEQLRAKSTSLPGVTEALAQFSAGGQSPVQEPAVSLPPALKKQLHSPILFYRREKKRFQARYRQLQKEYDREAVQESQRCILDICAGNYTAWRAEERRAKVDLPTDPTQIRRPLPDPALQKELIAADERCAKGVLEQLSDFADVRDKAAKLHTQFRGLTRLWTPDVLTSNAKRFCRFSIAMGLVFLVLMLLPFLLIGGQAEDLRVSRTAAHLINAGVFLVLYVLGVALWLRRMAKQIRALRVELELLILNSQLERKRSVQQVITTYTEVLPACLIQRLNYNAVLDTDARNETAYRKYELHQHYIKQAIQEITDVRTALRAQGINVQGMPRKESVNYLYAPYHEINQSFYLLFKERGRR